MINNKNLAIIPARSGSKGLPGKNIRQLIDKPLIAWSIEQALACKYISEVIVSTDSQEIADIAIAYGAKVPFLRPAYLAEDHSTTSDVLIHVIEELVKKNEVYEYLFLLEPTSPLRETKDINLAFETLLNTPTAKSIVGVSRNEAQHPDFCVSLTDKGFLESSNSFKVIRRQNIKDSFFFEGSIYISEIKYYLASKNFYHDKCLGFVFPKWKSFEIDDITDFVIAEAILKNKKLIKDYE
jgi:N-acylneuraminate cytidylyltransferase/CMP-N,N'-diacetyllegionaminic acid synthase